MPKRVPKSERKTNNILLLLNEPERDALDRQLEEIGVDRQTFFRTIINAADDGRLPAALLFQR